jgi:hypothetical protein
LYEWLWASWHEAPCSRALLSLMALSSVLFTLDYGDQLGTLWVAAWTMSALLLGLVLVVREELVVSRGLVVAARVRLGVVLGGAIVLSVGTGLGCLVGATVLTGLCLALDSLRARQGL